MLYLCDIIDNKLYVHFSFLNEQEFGAWLTYRRTYDDLVSRQRLVDTDIRRYSHTVFDKSYYTVDKTVTTLDRDIRLIDEYGRTLDVRDYRHLIPDSKTLFDEWCDRTFHKPRIAKRNRRQGRTHRKSGHYTHLTRYIEPDSELNDIRIRHCNRISRKPVLWQECFETAENNWKSKKVEHQYMWHKPRHKAEIKADNNNAFDQLDD